MHQLKTPLCRHITQSCLSRNVGSGYHLEELLNPMLWNTD